VAYHPGHEETAHVPRVRRAGRLRGEEAAGVLSLVLFATDAATARYGEQWLTVIPDLQIFQLRGPDVPDAATLGTFDIALLSADLWEGNLPAFMRACLAAPNLAWLHGFNAGTDHPVFGRLLAKGVRLTTSSGAAAAPIAHTVLMYLLAMTRDTPRWYRTQAAREWDQRDIQDMEERTVGVLGMGPIGLEIARLCAGFGMRVIGMRRTPHGDEPCETWPLERLHELLPLVDDLVLAIPLTEDTRGLIGADELAMMRQGAHLANIGRGELLDEPAMIASLQDGHLGAAALDVFAVEPLPQDSPLWAMPNVIVTPHSSGNTEITRRRAAAMFLDNLGRFHRGEPLVNEVLATTTS
jgi:phosphoglycerate dehydrogenase-like enzyme